MLTHSKRSWVWLSLLLVWFAVLITWALSISQVELDTSLQVRGAHTYVVGQRSVIRVVGLDLKFQRPIPIDRARVRWSNDQKTLEWQSLSKTPNLIWQNQISTPTQPGQWQLETSVMLRNKEVLASATVDIGDSPDTIELPGFSEITPAFLDETKPSQALSVFTFDGDLKRSFDNRIHLRMPSELPPTVSYKDLFGKTHVLEVNTLTESQQYAVTVRPELPSLKLNISDGGQQWVWHEDARPAFFDVREIKLLGNHTIETVIESRDKDRNFFVDVWYGDQWLATQVAAGGKRLNTVVFAGIDRDKVQGPLWVQAYRNAFNPSGQRGGRYVLTPAQVQRIEAEWSASQLGFRWKPSSVKHEGAHFLAGRLKAAEAVPKLLTDSAQLAGPKAIESQQFWLKLAGALLGISTLALILTLFLSVMRHRKRLEDRLLEVMTEEDAEEDEDTDVQRSWLDMVMTLGVMGLFLGGITWLFLTAKWG